MKENLIIIHGGGPTAVLNCSLYGAVREAQASGLVEHVYGAVGGTGGLLKEKLLDFGSVPEGELERPPPPPATAIGTSRDALEAEDYARMADILAEKHIRYVLMNGGNGTMDACGKLAAVCRDRGISVMGIPKTMDNDIAVTDHCPGFASAAKYIATSCAEVWQDAHVYDTGMVTIIEIMGRHAGWLAGAACLAGGDDCEGPDLILLPEVPFDQDKFLAKVDALQRVKPNVIIAASEGVKTADGTYLCDLVSTAGQLDAFGHKAVLSGTSRYLSELIHDKLNCKSRAIEFSTLQRCASHLASRTDVNEAYAVGGAAAAAAFAGESGRMIALERISSYPYQCIAKSVDVQQVANLEKKVPLDWITPDGMQVTAAFEEYARPLILDEVTPVYVNGTPRHIRL